MLFEIKVSSFSLFSNFHKPVMQQNFLKTILFIVVLLFTNIYLNAQATIYPEVAFGSSNAKGSGTFLQQYSIAGAKAGVYTHVGILGRINIKNSNVFITTGFVVHFYGVNYSSNGNASTLNKRVINVFKGFPLLINYDINPTKSKSMVLSAGIKYSVTNPQSLIGGKNEIAGIASVGYKINRANLKLFYTGSLNQLGLKSNTQSVKFNAVGLSVNISMYAGRNK